MPLIPEVFLNAVGIALLGQLVHSISLAEMPSRITGLVVEISVGSERSLHRNIVTGFWFSFLTYRFLGWNFWGALSSEDHSAVWFHLGWVEQDLMLQVGSSSVSKYQQVSGVVGKNTVWIPLGNSLQLITRRKPRAVSKDRKRKRMPSFSTYGSEL